MAKSIYDKFGFDKFGYNKDGFDRMGYNREGYDREGYDRNGLNQQGINKLTGFDKDGYDQNGFDKDGYDRDGYDCDGFSADGFSREGYNREGYDKYGLDAEGYNCQGYNAEGYDRNGFNRAGYDKEGFDKDGYDKEGYDREGFNTEGINREGYDCNGIDIYGFNHEGMNENGFDIYGISETGINILGYYQDGFDSDGYSIDGFSKDSFDEDGYHIYTGFNLKGYNREGFNINGVDAEGYDCDGYHYESGFNRDGYDREGYGRAGYNKEGYNRSGFNRKGYDHNGFDSEGFDEQGYDSSGYNREGYDSKGYDVNGYDMYGTLNPELKQKEIAEEMDPEQDRYEASFFKKCEAQIKRYYRNQVEKEIMKEYTPIKRQYIDRWGFLQTDTIQPDIKQAQVEINYRVNSVLKEPYFCHVDYSGNPELYLGKQEVHGWITDWADERASIYYQYQMYIGNKEIGLNIVRDIMISKGNYKGYKDLYNRTGNKENVGKIADEHLSQIIEANQKNKKIHDIIESIQQNQYRIITSDKDVSSLVLGCAGSGKTMILMHKIRYMKYNHRELKMDEIMVISPTDILGRESKELSKLLQIERIQQFTTATFYEICCKELLTQLNVDYEEFHVVDDGEVIESCYERSIVEELKSRIYFELGNDETSKAFYAQQQVVIKEQIDNHLSLLNLKKDTITEMHKLYADSVREIQRAGKKDIERMIRQIEFDVRQREAYENVREFVEFLRSSKIFKNSSFVENLDREHIEKLFFRTRQVVDAMDFYEFSRMRFRKEIISKTPVQSIQIIQLFMENKLDLQGVHNLLDEWMSISEQEANEYIKYIDCCLVKIERLDRKKDVLQLLLDNAMVKSRIAENNTLRYDTSFEKLLKLFEGTQEILNDIGYTPFTYFEEYDKIIRRRKRLTEQKKNPKGRAYLYDAILDALNVEYKTDSDILLPLSKAFEMTYFLYGYAGNISIEKRYMFIDEFQDFSPLELELFKNLYPNAVVNLFGDVKQCINKKGIQSISEIPADLYDEKPETINENYRNARQITDYVNEISGMEMIPVGLDGIQKTVEEIPELELFEDDRVAIILADKTNYFDDYKCCMDLNFYVESRKIVRGIYNVLPISLAKGLEFEKVIVIQEGMTENEFYVACTRAISELYVIPGKMFETEKEQTVIVEIMNMKTKTGNARSLDGILMRDAKKMEQLDIHDYKLFAYQGKLKKYTGVKGVPMTYIPVFAEGKEKKIPVCYLKDKKWAYILESTYNKYKKELDEYFSVSPIIMLSKNAVVKEKKTDVPSKADVKDVTSITKIPQKKAARKVRDLEICIFDDTRTVELMDRFEGIGTEKPYDRLILKNAMYIRVGSLGEMIDLVVERSKSKDFQGNITFTEYKKGEIYDLREYIENQFTEKEIQNYKKSGELYKFSKPYLLRAQNSRNRSGYGWEWDWSDPYAPLVNEGTLYGETTNYVFVGAYIGKG